MIMMLLTRLMKAFMQELTHVTWCSRDVLYPMMINIAIMVFVVVAIVYALDRCAYLVVDYVIG